MLVMTILRDARHADLGRPGGAPERRGVRIRCDHPGCAQSVLLTDGVGCVGSKVFYCPTHGAFGPGTDRLKVTFAACQP